MNQHDVARDGDLWRRFRRRFSERRCVFLAAVYASEPAQALQNVAVAEAAQADGVVLVNHGLDSRSLLQLAAIVIDRNPDLFVAANCLDLNAAESIQRAPRKLGGVWTALDYSKDLGDLFEEIKRVRRRTAWDGLLFAQAASCNKLLEIVRADAEHQTIDVAIVAGDRHSPADLTCRELKTACTDRPLGVAASVGAAMLDQAARALDCIVCSASVGRPLLANMDPDKASQLARSARERGYV